MVWPAIIAALASVAGSAMKAKADSVPEDGYGQNRGPSDASSLYGGDTISQAHLTNMQRAQADANRPQLGMPGAGAGRMDFESGSLEGLELGGGDPMKRDEMIRAGGDEASVGGGFGDVMGKLAAGAKVGASLRGRQPQAPAPPNFGGSARPFGADSVALQFRRPPGRATLGQFLQRFRR